MNILKRSFNCLVRKKCPEFTANALLPSGSFGKICPQDYSNKYWLLFFYPLDFTFVCPTELLQFNHRFQQFKDIDCDIVGASVDSEYAHLAWTRQPTKEGGLGGLMKYPLIADVSKELSKAFGILCDGVALRATFLIDKQGIVRFAGVNDLALGRSVGEMERLVRTVQHADAHGEVCPADWIPGKPAINPNKADDYFKNNKC